MFRVSLFFRAILIIGYFLSNSLHAISLLHIREKTIIECKEKIIQELDSLKKLKTSLVTVFACAGIYGVYSLFGTSPQSNTVPIQLEIPPIADANALLQQALVQLKDDKIFMQEIKQQLAQGGFNIGLKVTWGQWLKSWCDFFGRQYSFMMMSILATHSINPFSKYFKAFDRGVDTTVNYFFHNNDLEWFLDTHTNVEKTSKLLDQEFEKLFESYCAKQQSNTCIALFEINSLITVWHLMIEQITNILGFMNYKIEYLKKQNALKEAVLHDIKERLWYEVDTITSKLETLIEMMLAGSYDVQRINESETPFHQLQKTLSQSLSQFVSIESLITY